MLALINKARSKHDRRTPLKVIIATEMNVKSQRTSVIHGMSILLPSSKAKQLVIV